MKLFHKLNTLCCTLVLMLETVDYVGEGKAFAKEGKEEW